MVRGQPIKKEIVTEYLVDKPVKGLSKEEIDKAKKKAKKKGKKK